MTYDIRHDGPLSSDRRQEFEGNGNGNGNGKDISS